MNNNIIEFKSINNKTIENLNLDDIFNLLLIFKQEEGILVTFNLDIVMQSLAKYKDIEKFKCLYNNLLIERNETDEQIINLENCLDKNIKEKIILQNPNEKSELIILADEDYFTILKSTYTTKVLSLFNELMFYINNDLEFGINNWQLFAEDEYIEDKIYPGIVTGEFISQKKDSKVMKKVREKAIENFKNLYK